MKLVLEIEPGETIEDACREAQKFSNVTHMPVTFTFNSVDCVAVPGGDPELLAQRQHHASQSRLRVTSEEGAMTWTTAS